MGPIDPVEVQKEFESFAFRSMEVDASIFFTASIEAVRASMNKQLAARFHAGMVGTEYDVNFKSLAKVLPPGGVLCLHDHIEFFNKEMAHKGNQMQYVADISQWQSSKGGTSCNAWMPNLVIHGAPVSFSLQRAALTNELLSTMGVDCYNETTVPVTNVIFESLMDARQAHHRFGNAVHVKVLAYWFAYVYSHLVLVPKDRFDPVLTLEDLDLP